MNQTNNLEIPLSKTKLMLMLGGAMLFVACGFWFVISPPVIRHPLFGNPPVLFAVGISAIIFFGLCALIAVRKLFDKTPGFIIGNQGFVDNSSGVSAGVIPWNDVVRVEKHNLMGQNFLVFIVQNPEEYLNRQTNPLKRKTMAINLKSYGSPITVSANTLQISFDELAALVERKLAERQLSV